MNSNRIRYTLDDVVKNTFYQMPKFLFAGEFKKLNNDARVLYSILKDRHELSITNEWTNENNEVYIIFSREEMCEVLGLSENTVLKAMNALKKYELLQEERQGMGRPNKIFLLTVKSAIIPQNLKSCGSLNSTFEVDKPQDLRILPIYNNTYVSETNHSQCQTETKKEQSFDNDIDKDSLTENTPQAPEKIFTYDYDKSKKTIHENIYYNHYKQYSNNDDIELIDELVECMLDVICTEEPTVKINGEKKNRAMVIQQYLKINSSDINHILEQFKNQKNKITHLNSYLKTMLYTTKQEQGHYYTNAVRADGLI